MVTLAVLPGMLKTSLVVADLANPGNSSKAINLLVSQPGIVGLGGCRLERIHFEQEEWQEVPAKADERVSEITADVWRVMQSNLTDREEDVLRTTYHWYDPTKEHQKLPEAVLSSLAKRWNTTPDNIRQIRSRALRKLKDALESVVARPSDER